MEKKDEELIQTLLDRDAELKHHWDEHQDLERQLSHLQGRLHLSAEEEVEKKRLQKLKLAGKDRIMEILAKHRPH
jgi:uncharacterized protein YdcH (DUF465 family)